MTVLRAALAAGLLLATGCGQGPAGQAGAAPRAEGGTKAPGGPAAAMPFAQVRFATYRVADRLQGGMTAMVLAVPEGWRPSGDVAWNYSDYSLPARVGARVVAGDGSAWVEVYPFEMFYELSPPDRQHAAGTKSYGMIHHPGIGAAEAMRRYVIQRYRGRAQGLQFVGSRPVPNLPAAVGDKMAGESMAARVRYTLQGRSVEEDFFLHLGPPNRIPYHGPQGTTYQTNRFLGYVHSLAAFDGKLDSVYPLLGFVARSARYDAAWLQYRNAVIVKLGQQYDRELAAGYSRIAAAGRLSRAISANNDAMISAMDAQRRSSNASMDRIHDNFSQYIRGTERMQDPYWGTSEHSYTNKYHWTDGNGNYQHSNDAGFNPNAASNGNWQLMQSAGR